MADNSIHIYGFWPVPKVKTVVSSCKLYNFEDIYFRNLSGFIPYFNCKIAAFFVLLKDSCLGARECWVLRPRFALSLFSLRYYTRQVLLHKYSLLLLKSHSGALNNFAPDVSLRFVREEFFLNWVIKFYVHN